MEQTQPVEVSYELPAGAFRGLHWAAGRSPSVDGCVLFLHGLSGTADVWDATVRELGERRPECLAIDQRGHGSSVVPVRGYAVADYVADVVALAQRLPVPLRLVGHSMGGRVALVAAARFPQLFRSVAIVDIGPEAWKKNITETVRLLRSRPEELADRAAAADLRADDRHSGHDRGPRDPGCGAQHSAADTTGTGPGAEQLLGGPGPLADRHQPAGGAQLAT